MKKGVKNLIGFQIIFLLIGSLAFWALSYPEPFFLPSDVVVTPQLDCLDVFRTAHDDIYIIGCEEKMRIANTESNFTEGFVLFPFYYKDGEVYTELNDMLFSSKDKGSLMLEIPIETENGSEYLIQINNIEVWFHYVSRLVIVLITLLPTIVFFSYLKIKKVLRKKR